MGQLLILARIKRVRPYREGHAGTTAMGLTLRHCLDQSGKTFSSNTKKINDAETQEEATKQYRSVNYFQAPVGVLLSTLFPNFFNNVRLISYLQAFDGTDWLNVYCVGNHFEYRANCEGCDQSAMSLVTRFRKMDLDSMIDDCKLDDMLKHGAGDTSSVLTSQQGKYLILCCMFQIIEPPPPRNDETLYEDLKLEPMMEVFKKRMDVDLREAVDCVRRHLPMLISDDEEGGSEGSDSSGSNGGGAGPPPKKMKKTIRGRARLQTTRHDDR